MEKKTSETKSYEEMKAENQQLKTLLKEAAHFEQAYHELNSIFTNSMVGILILKGGRFIARANQRFVEILGYNSPEHLIGKSVKELHLSEENFIEFGTLFYDSLTKREIVQLEYQLKKKDGSPVWLTISGKAIDPNEPPDLNTGVVWIMDDITSRKKTEQQLIELATIDPLTAINNRRHFIELAEREFTIHTCHSRTLAVLMLDIDRFKLINDQYGHSTGDKALQHFASTSAECLRSADIFGRIGGEEFAVILPDTSMEQAAQVAERMRESIELQSFDWQGLPPMTVSIGIATSKEGKDLEEAMRYADLALYDAKENGRNRIELYRSWRQLGSTKDA